MRLKSLITTFLAAGISLSVCAQTHKEGEEYYKADQLANAKELLLRNFNNPGTDKAVSNYYLGLIALKENNKADAKKYFTEGVSANPEYPFNYVGLGQLDLMNNDEKAANDNFKLANKYRSKEQKSEVDIAIARAYYDVNPELYQKKIDDKVKEAIKNSPKDGFAHTDESIYLFEGDRLKDQGIKEKDQSYFGKAATQYENATKYNPNATEAYVKYANLFTQVNQQYAIDMLNNLLAINPTSALGQRELANAYYNAGKYNEAATEYQKYIKNPNHFKQDEDRYAFLLFYGGKFQDGYDYATELFNANPSNFTAQRYQFMNAAQLENMHEQLLPMAEKLLAAHNSNPNNKFAPIDYILIGGELSDAGRPADAQALFEEAIAENPNNPEYYKQLALVYVNENNLSKASDTFQQYIDRKDAGYNDIVQQATYAFYAGVENQQSNPEEAQRYYEMARQNAQKALEMSTQYPKPYKILGDIAKQTASESEAKSAAIPYYTDAINIIESSGDPSRYASDAKSIYVYLGNYYLENNDKAQAIDYFNKYLTLDPNNESFIKLVESLK